jgi:hypothetical protein
VRSHTNWERVRNRTESRLSVAGGGLNRLGSALTREWRASGVLGNFGSGIEGLRLGRGRSREAAVRRMRRYAETPFSRTTCTRMDLSPSSPALRVNGTVVRVDDACLGALGALPCLIRWPATPRILRFQSPAGAECGLAGRSPAALGGAHGLVAGRMAAVAACAGDAGTALRQAVALASVTAGACS